MKLLFLISVVITLITSTSNNKPNNYVMLPVEFNSVKPGDTLVINKYNNNISIYVYHSSYEQVDNKYLFIVK